MSSNLSPDTEAFIEAQLSTGSFPNRSTVLEAGIELLKDHMALAERLKNSRKQLDQGDHNEYDDVELAEFFDGLRKRANSAGQKNEHVD